MAGAEPGAIAGLQSRCFVVVVVVEGPGDFLFHKLDARESLVSRLRESQPGRGPRELGKITSRQ